MSLLCRDQLFRSCLRALVIICTVVSVEAVGRIAKAQQVRIVPSISVREMYDTNVFYADKNDLPPGLSADDFITIIVPQITVAQNNSLVSTNLSVGALIQKFAKNTDLDNVGFNAAAGIDISRLTNRYLPRMRTARFYGTYMYSPSTPPFGVGGMGAGMGGMGGGMTGGMGMGMGMMGGMTGGIGGVGIGGPLDTGLLAQRTRVQIYNIGFNNSYALSPSADFQTSLTYSRLSFGGSYTPTEAQQSGQALTFDTTSYNVSAGPSARISAVDSLGFVYVFSQTSQANFGTFSTHTGNLNWSHTWTREIFSSVRGGMTLVEPIPINQFSSGTTQSTGRVAATMFPTGGFSLTYASASSLLRAMGSDLQSVSPSGGVGVVGGSFLPVLAGSTVPGTISSPGMYSVSLNYNLGVYPSYVASAGPIYSHIIGLNGAAGITDRLSAFGGFNFAHSSFTSQVNTGTFDSYGTIVMLNYLVTQSLQASLSHQWLNFSGSSEGGGASDFGLSKHMVMLGISYAYSPRGDFFRSGAFWESPSSGSSTTGPAPSQSGSGGVEIKK